MDDLIDRQKLLKKKQYSFQTEYGAFPRHDYFIKISDIRSMSAVDTERHAHWIKNEVSSGQESWTCSVCGRRARGKKENLPYCHCGCKMDEVTNNDD
ncbi:hypothetical protein [uncultured Eubacterium sp.]|uniref:hypothetical protein n=1 Tax=uncultured Eubacterium sp. TaxID=165185 RepID=UPI0025F94B3D|nr:hypothetical protein [uncultured Eubacterium sp.]